MPGRLSFLAGIGLVLVGIAATDAQAAQSTTARIDIYAVDAALELRPAGASPDAKVGFCSWLGAGRDRTGLTSEAPLGREWRELWLAFVPAADGEVDIDLQGEYYERTGPEDVRLVWVDDVSVDGAQVGNGSFEEAAPGGRPDHWRFTGAFPGERYSRDGTVARSGRSCIAVWYGAQGRQKFAVEAGRTYRVSAWFRAMDPGAIPQRISHAGSVQTETYDQEVILTFVSPEAARRATFGFAPLSGGREWSVSARWDDNNTLDLKMRDVMQAHGYRGTFYLTGDQGWYGPDGGGTDPTELGKKLLDGGNTIGGHSMTHPYLSYLNRNRQFWEVAAVRMLWEARLDRPVNSYAFSFCDFRNGVEGDAGQRDIAESLRRAGYLNIANGWFNDQMDTDLLLSPILPSDGAPIEATAETWLSNPGKRTTSPHMSFSMHVWYRTPEAWARFEGELDAYGSRPDWWYCNHNQYAAYRWQATKARLQRRQTNDARMVLALERPVLSDLGEDVPLTLSVKGVAADEVAAASCDGQPLPVGAAADGTVVVELAHSPGQVLPELIGYIENPTNAPLATEAHVDPDFPGLRGVLHATDEALRVSLTNDTGTPLGAVAVTYRLPPGCEPGVVRRRPQARGETLSDGVPIVRPGAGYKHTAGEAFYAAQVDFEWGGRPARLHLGCRQRPPARDASFPQGGFMVAGPTTADLVDEMLPVEQVAWRPEQPEHVLAMDPEVVATSGQWRAPDGERQHWLLRSTVVSGLRREVAFVSEGDSVRAIYLNGERLAGRNGALLAGENDLLVVARGSNGGFGRTNAGCFLRVVEPGTRTRVDDIEFRRPRQARSGGR